MNNYKIYIPAKEREKITKAVQEHAFTIGYKWGYQQSLSSTVQFAHACFLIFTENVITYTSDFLEFKSLDDHEDVSPEHFLTIKRLWLGIKMGEYAYFWDGDERPDYPSVRPFFGYNEVNDPISCFYSDSFKGYSLGKPGNAWDHVAKIEKPKPEKLGLWVAVDSFNKYINFSPNKMNDIEGGFCGSANSANCWENLKKKIGQGNQVEL